MRVVLNKRPLAWPKKIRWTAAGKATGGGGGSRHTERNGYEIREDKDVAARGRGYLFGAVIAVVPVPHPVL